MTSTPRDSIDIKQVLLAATAQCESGTVGHLLRSVVSSDGSDGMEQLLTLAPLLMQQLGAPLTSKKTAAKLEKCPHCGLYFASNID